MLYLGKREPGLLTAASPGDTLYFAFSCVNEVGASVADTGFAVTDIEVFKNGDAVARATDSGYSLISDTGMLGNRVGLYRFKIQIYNTADDTGFFDVGSHYLVAVDSIKVSSQVVRFYAGSFEIGRQKVNAVELVGDTGAANWLKSTFAAGFADTGIQERLGRIQSDVDTGLRVHIDDLDTGLHAHISDVDTGLHAILALQDTGAVATAVWAGDTGLRDHITNVDTGVTQRLDLIRFDVDTGLRTHIDDLDTGLHSILQTVGVNIAAIRGDTGAASWLKSTFLNGFADTGLYSRIDKLAEDTGGVNINSIQGDTGAAGWLKATFLNGLHDTGLNDRLGRVQSDVDTGLRDTLADYDTGLRDLITDSKNELDTGIKAVLALADTGKIATAVWAGDTGLRDHITNVDTGLTNYASAIKVKTDSLTFTVAGQVDSNIQYVNDVAITGTGDTGAGNTWRPA